LIVENLAEQEMLNRTLLDRTIVTESDPVGTRLAQEWFSCCARDGILGVRVPLWFILALARRAVIGGLKTEPDFAAVIIDYLQIPRNVAADSLVTALTAAMSLLARVGRLGPATRIYERVGDYVTSRLIKRLE
jgi:hypothetical protein